MIFSVTEQREELLAIDERRRQIAAQSAQPVTNSESVTATPLVASAMPATGCGSPSMAVKAAQPAISKRRKKGKRAEREDRDLVSAATRATGEGYLAAQAAEAELDAGDDAEAAKAALDRGVLEGPGRYMRTGPGQPPASYSRPYLSDGHAAASPMHEAPTANPLPDLQTYVPPGDPAVAAVPSHVTDRATLRSPSDR